MMPIYTGCQKFSYDFGLLIEHIKIQNQFINNRSLKKIVFESSYLFFYRINYLFHSCFTMKPTYLKFDTLTQMLKIVTFCSSEKFEFPERKQYNEKLKILDERFMISVSPSLQ